jgi:hypothetical protein
VRLLSVRLIVSLILGITMVSLFSTYYEVRREKRGLRNDLERRAEVLGESLVGNVEPELDKGSLKQLSVSLSGLAAENTWPELQSSTRSWNRLPNPRS